MFSSHADYRRLEEDARRALPPDVFDFFAGGAGDEATLAAGEAAWGRTALRPHVLRDVSAVDTRTRVLGREAATPLGVAPVGYQRLAHPAARSRRRAGRGGPGRC